MKWEAVKSASIDRLLKLYVHQCWSWKKILADEESITNGSQKLENGDETLALWQWFRIESFSGIQPSLQWIAKSIWQLQEKPSLMMNGYCCGAFSLKKDCWVRRGSSCQSWIWNWTSSSYQKSDGATLWLQPCRKTNTNLQKSVYVVGQSNLPTSNNSKAVHKRWAAMIGLRHCPCSVWISNKER